MGKIHRSWNTDAQHLLPPSIDDHIAADADARIIRDLARSDLDLPATHGSYRGAKGQPPFHPSMMTARLHL